MKFLVEMTTVETGQTKSEWKGLIEDNVFPSFEKLKSWESEKRVIGGIPLGERRLVFVLEAKDNKDCDDAIKSLPFWGMCK